MKNYSTLKIDGFDGHLVLYCKNHYNVKNIDLITGFQRMWAVRCGHGIECIDKGSLEHIADRLFKILSQTNGFDSVHFLKRLHNEISKTYLNRYEGLTPIEILIYFYASEIMQLQVYDTKNKITFIELPKPKKRLFNRILKGNWEFIVFNLNSNQFEVFSAQTRYLRVKVDKERMDCADVIFFYDIEREPYGLALNCEDDKDTFRAVELFNQMDKRFALYLDFYRFDNIHFLFEIFE